MHNRNLWDYWKGKKVQSKDTNEIFIATNNTNWSHRLSIWKDNVDTCPRPMPQDHIMFEKDHTNYKEVI